MCAKGGVRFVVVGEIGDPLGRTSECGDIPLDQGVVGGMCHWRDTQRGAWYDAFLEVGSERLPMAPTCLHHRSKFLGATSHIAHKEHLVWTGGESRWENLVKDQVRPFG